MVELACEADPRFEASRLEEDTERSYSVDTIRKVRASLRPDDELFFIIGADAFSDVRTWHRWEEVVGSVRFIVASRPGYSYDEPAGAIVEPLQSVNLPVSSSQLRRSLTAGLRAEGVPLSVMHYIEAHGLYPAVSR